MDVKTELLSIFDDFVTEEDKETSEILMMLSNEIIKSRLDMKMTQKEFAKFLECSQSMISKIESEEYNFTIEKLVNIFSKLGKRMEISIKSKTEPKETVKTEYVVNDSYVMCTQEFYEQYTLGAEDINYHNFWFNKKSETRYS